MKSRHFVSPLLVSVLCVPTLAQTTPPPSAPSTETDENALNLVPTGGTPTAPTRPQPPAGPFANVGGFALSGYLRSRVEHFDFFKAANGDHSYTFTGHQLRVSGVKTTPQLDVQLDLQQVVLTNLPDNAFFRPNPTTSVPLGVGANYALANGNQDGALSVKQAFVRFKNAVGQGSSVRLGRFEFNEGTETTLKDPSLNFLKTQRIAQRLVGIFGFTHSGRAFDGAHLSTPLAKGNFTLVGARPTEGVFQLEANDNIDAVSFLWGAYTRPVKDGDARVFGMAYEDGRESPKSVKLDNRPLAVRTADDGKIRVYTLGANYLRTFKTSDRSKFDVVAWGAAQVGDWGAQDHSGQAFLLETGYQPLKVKWRPWLRAGYYQASGDDDPNDNKHKTFFTPLTTPRLNARYPFYNQMNVKDTFAQLLLRPSSKANWRLEAHSLRLDNANDLLYFGGGAFQDNGFGFGGRPSGGSSRLATVFDVSLDYTFNPKTSMGLYFGRALGKDVIRNNYSQNQNANFAFVEFTRKF